MSVRWVSTGARGDLALTNLNVGNGAFFVDKNTNRVGIKTTTPEGILQVGAPADQGVSHLNPLSGSGVTIMADKVFPPLLDGNNNLGGTLWINSTVAPSSNKGASIALGGRGVDGLHTTFGRISGVLHGDSTTSGGDVVVETTERGSIKERLRVKSSGRIGLGVSDPEGNLHVSEDIICGGIWNKGYRRDSVDGALIAPGSAVKVPHGSFATALRPEGKHPGWLYRIDGSGSKHVNGSVTDPSDGSTYVVGTFKGTLVFYDPDHTSPRETPVFDSETGSMAFVAKFSEDGRLRWAAKIDGVSDCERGMGITMLESSVIITGSFLTENTLVAYHGLDPPTAYKTTLSNDKGGFTGFVLKYSSEGFVEALSKIDGFGDVILSCARGASANSFYVGGYHNVKFGNLTAYNKYNVATVTAPATLEKFDAFVCKYDENLSPAWISVIKSTGEDFIGYLSRGIDVDEVGNVYVAGYSSGITTFLNSNGSTFPVTLTIPGPSRRMGFLARMSNMGVFDWVAKITSDKDAKAHSISVTPNGFVYVVGDFSGTVYFRDKGETRKEKTTQRTHSSLDAKEVEAGFLAQYTSSGVHIWSTKIQASGSEFDREVTIVDCDTDEFDNCYVAFQSRVDNPSIRSDVSIFQRNSPKINGIAKDTSSISFHRVSGKGGVVGVVGFNIDGKVLYSVKIDSDSTDKVGSLSVYQKLEGDRYPRIILSGWTFGRDLCLTDPTGNVCRYINDLTTAKTSMLDNTGFVAHFPTFSTYVIEHPSASGLSRRFINESNGRAFIIPYYDIDSDPETGYTKGVFEASAQTSLELFYAGASDWILNGSIPFLSCHNGNVGIGVAQPSSLLQVEGTASIAGNVGIGTKTPESRLSVFANGINDTYVAVINQANPLANGLSVVSSSTAYSQRALSVETDGDEVFAIKGDGSVNIRKTLTVENVKVTGLLSATAIEGALPPGVIMLWVLPDPPVGWLLCEGQEEKVEDYPALSSLLGISYGTPRSGFFRLPKISPASQDEPSNVISMRYIIKT
jgi:hypothetical protein